MTVSITVDTSELDAYVATLRGIPPQVLPKVAPVFKRAAHNVKTATQADMRGSGNAGFRAIAGHVQYDEPAMSGSGLETEIGINKGGAGSLGNIAVFGTYKGGGTRLHPSFHMAAELPSFESHVLAAVEGLF